jgi:hypothetical protein
MNPDRIQEMHIGSGAEHNPANRAATLDQQSPFQSPCFFDETSLNTDHATNGIADISHLYDAAKCRIKEFRAA